MCHIRIPPKPQLPYAVKNMLTYLLAVTRSRFTATGWEGSGPVITTCWAPNLAHRMEKPVYTAAPSFTSNS